MNKIQQNVQAIREELEFAGIPCLVGPGIVTVKPHTNTYYIISCRRRPFSIVVRHYVDYGDTYTQEAPEFFDEPAHVAEFIGSAIVGM